MVTEEMLRVKGLASIGKYTYRRKVWRIRTEVRACRGKLDDILKRRDAFRNQAKVVIVGDYF